MDKGKLEPAHEANKTLKSLLDDLEDLKSDCASKTFRIDCKGIRRTKRGSPVKGGHKWPCELWNELEDEIAKVRKFEGLELKDFI